MHPPTYGIAHKGAELATENNGFRQKMERFAPYVCEFVGSFMLALTSGCCAFARNPSWNPTAIASVYMVLVYAFRPISGGHFNPAVTITVAFCGKAAWWVVLPYVVVQIVASLSAGLICNGIFGATVAIGPVGAFTFGSAAFVEVVYTAMLCFVFANCVVSLQNDPKQDKNQFFALAIGFVVVAGGYPSGSVSGAIFNPAVAIGLDLTTPGNGVTNGFIYALYELLGAIIATVLFFCVRLDELKQVDREEPPLLCRILGEFLGTFWLVFTVCLNIAMQTAATPWSAAAALMCMIYSLADVTGGHFNPAVSLAVVLSGRRHCQPRDGFVYGVTQLLAGVIAALAVSYVQSGGPERGAIGLGPQEGHLWGEAFLAEMLFTSLVAYIVLAVATTTYYSPNFYFALAIGSCITAGGFAIGAISGGAMNPAVAFGIATEGEIKVVAHAAEDTATTTMFGVVAMSGPRPWANCISYSAFQLLGGVLAALVFHVTHPHEFIKGASPLP